ncbi:hypothetical protein GE09DRAFT_488783 [Coniochaeta sp. 2T2.1]|nr:hypothetical protein GE09DRAFT_488783 [Coniochaeta sp. 2T2.1]
MKGGLAAFLNIMSRNTHPSTTGTLLSRVNFDRSSWRLGHQLFPDKEEAEYRPYLVACPTGMGPDAQDETYKSHGCHKHLLRPLWYDTGLQHSVRQRHFSLFRCFKDNTNAVCRYASLEVRCLMLEEPSPLFHSKMSPSTAYIHHHGVNRFTSTSPPHPPPHITHNISLLSHPERGPKWSSGYMVSGAYRTQPAASPGPIYPEARGSIPRQYRLLSTLSFRHTNEVNLGEKSPVMVS